MKKSISFLVVLFLCISMIASFGLADSRVEDIIKQAEQMTREELYKKAIEESNGQSIYAISTSSRGKTAGAQFVEVLKSIDPNYTLNVEWSQPKNNSIFTSLEADIKGNSHIYSLTMIRDDNQLKAKMLDTNYLLNFVPLEWKNAQGVDVDRDSYPLAMLKTNKVFMFNNTGTAEFKNCWDFVYKDVHPMFMGVDSEIVGKSFLYTLTHPTNAKYLKDAFDKLPQEKQDYFMPTIQEMEEEALLLSLEGEYANYALAWIKLWCLGFAEDTDDGPICANLVSKTASDKCALIVYSKLRSVEESASSSVNNITVAAYQDDYVGIGGFDYSHYLMLTKDSPLPWTSCAFISYMMTTQEGFSAWGKNMGGYASNPEIMIDHSKDGYVDGENLYPAKNDRGYEWWSDPKGGQLVVEDIEYCAKVAFELGDWIDIIIGSK